MQQDTTCFYFSAMYNQASEIVAIPVERILGPCVYISFASVKDYVYVAMLVNTVEKD